MTQPKLRRAKRAASAPEAVRRRATPAPETDGRRARRVRTEARLLTALEALLQAEGVAALGVNAVAERARVEKVLIYRYFGGLEGLMAAYAQRSDFWPSLDEILGADFEREFARDRAKAAARLLSNYAQALRKRPVTLDLLAWECAHRNPLTEALEAVREQRAQEVFARLAAAGVELSSHARELSALFAGAINYLALRSRQVSVFAGLGVRGDAAWQRIEAVMAVAFESARLEVE
jgi:AcrR family transcriptional regulator